MDRLELIFAEYVRLRTTNQEMNAAFNLLRKLIEPLPKSDKRELVTRIRAWEQTQARASKNQVSQQSSRSTQILEPLVVLIPNSEEKFKTQPIKPESKTENQTKIKRFQPAPTVTQMLNPKHLPPSMVDTQPILQIPEVPAEDQEEHFGADTVLELSIRGTSRKFRLRPQQHEHEIFIGRRTENSAMSPDVDLSGWNGEKMGVSQLHLSIKHDPNTNMLLVYDLSSTNGSYINGRRLLPNRGEVIRHGDDLQLGHMILYIRFLEAAVQAKTGG